MLDINGDWRCPVCGAYDGNGLIEWLEEGEEKMAEQSTYFYLPRNLVYRKWWKDPAAANIFVFLVAKAFLKDQTMHSGLVLKRGQWLGWAEEIADKTGIQTKNVVASLKKLERCGEIKCERASDWWLITINNFEMYQEGEDGG